MIRMLAVALALAAIAGPAAAQTAHQIAVGPLHVPFWADGGPVRITVRVANLGSVREDYRAPDTSLTATIAGHGTVVFPDFSVEPGATQTVAADWESPPLLCICRVHVSTTNRHGQPIELEQRVIVFPVRVVGGFLVAALGLSLLAWLRRSRRRPEEVEPAVAAPVDERPLAERTAPPPVEPEPARVPEPRPEPEPEPEAEPEPEPVPGLEEPPPPEQPTVPEAVRDLPRADELPDWFVRLRTGAPLEPEKRSRRR